MSRWIVGGQIIPSSRKLGKSWLRRGAIIAVLVLGGSFLTQILVKLFFGDTWSLPLIVFILFSSQEIARGYYQVRLSRIVTLGFDRTVRNVSLSLIFIAPIFSILGAKSLGTNGVPLGMAVGYLGLNLYLKKVTGKVTPA